MHNRLGTRALALLAILIPSSCGVPEDTTLACESCAIQLERVLVLQSGVDGPGGIYGAPSSIARDSHGRIYVTTPWVAGNELPYVYDASGEYLQRLGRPGEGPGELLDPEYLAVDEADSVLVFDRGTGRLTVYGPDLGFARTVPEIGISASSAARLGDGSILVNKTGSELPLHLYDAAGKLEASMGEAVTFRRDGSASLRRQMFVVPSLSGGVWTARRAFKYELCHWSTVGEATHCFAPEVGWFAPYDEFTELGPDDPQSPTIWGIWEDEHGLWVLAASMAPDWRDHVLDKPTMVEGIAVYSSDGSPIVDTIVQLLDSETGEVLATRRLNGRPFGQGFGPGLLARSRPSGPGFREIELWSVTLSSRETT